MSSVSQLFRRSFSNVPAFTASVAFCAGLASSPAAATDGYLSNGYGIQAEGLGGASVAYPKDSIAIASNPASALFLGNRFDAGVDYFNPDRGATITGNNLGHGYSLDGTYDGNARQDFLIPSLGYVRQVSPDLALGLVAYGNGGLSTAYKNNPFAALGSTGTAGVSFEQLFISPTAAYQIAPGQSIGASLNIGYQRITVKGLNAFAPSSSDSSNLTNNGVDEAFGIGARIGYLGQLTPQLLLGVTYETRTSFQDFSGYSGLFADHGAFDTPQNVSVGVAYKLNPRLDVTAEYEFINYSEINSVGNAGVAALLTGQKLGSSDGPGFNWQDANVFRIGANYQLTPQLQVRGGYAYSTEVIRDNETLLNILAPATVQSQFSAGFTWESASKRWEYSGYLFYAPTDKVSGAIPNTAQGFGGGVSTVKLSEFAAGFSVGYKFDQPAGFKD